MILPFSASTYRIYFAIKKSDIFWILNGAYFLGNRVTLLFFEEKIPTCQRHLPFDECTKNQQKFMSVGN